MNNDYKVIGSGVTIEDGVKIGKGVTIYQNNIIKGDTIIEDDVTILPNNFIKDSVLKKGSTIEFSYIENSEIGKYSQVGPFSRIRPNSIIGDFCKIGNFVEVKNSMVGSNTKACHLSYIGDVDIGRNCNIGSGSIFVNYNGKEKQRSVVGDGCFIGSNVNIIAPVNIGDNSYICAGTTLTKDTNVNDFVIGRVRETIKTNYATKYKK